MSRHAVLCLVSQCTGIPSKQRAASGSAWPQGGGGGASTPQCHWWCAVQVLEASMASFVAIGVLALLFMIVFAIVGLHVFGGALPSDTFPNFNTFFNSFLTMFQVCCLSHSRSGPSHRSTRESADSCSAVAMCSGVQQGVERLDARHIS